MKRVQVILTERWAALAGGDGTKAQGDETSHPGKGVTFNSMHPGWVDTPGLASGMPNFRESRGETTLRSSEEGADTVVWLVRVTGAGPTINSRETRMCPRRLITRGLGFSTRCFEDRSQNGMFFFFVSRSSPEPFLFQMGSFLLKFRRRTIRRYFWNKKCF